MDTYDDSLTNHKQDLDALAINIEWYLTGRSFCIVFEDQVDRYWPSKAFTDSERERQIQAFAESHGWNVFLHKSDVDRTRAIFLPG